MVVNETDSILVDNNRRDETPKALIDEYIRGRKLDLSDELLLKALKSPEIIEAFELLVEHAKAIDKNKFPDTVFDHDFKAVAKMILIKLLKEESAQKFSILIEDLQKFAPLRTQATLTLIDDIAKQIKLIATNSYLETKEAIHK